MSFRSFRLALILAVHVTMCSPKAYPAEADILECETKFAELVERLRNRPTLWPPITTQKVMAFKLSPENFQSLRIRTPDNMKILPAGKGAGFHELWEGTISGKKVFVKISPIKVGSAFGRGNQARRSIQELEKEVAWTQRLSELGIGPKFYGLIQKDGHYAIVTEHVEGVHMDADLTEFPSSFQPTRSLIDSIRQIEQTLRTEGIFGADIQFRVTPTRAYVIDPEYFEPLASPNAKSSPIPDEIIEELLENFPHLR